MKLTIYNILRMNNGFILKDEIFGVVYFVECLTQVSNATNWCLLGKVDFDRNEWRKFDDSYYRSMHPNCNKTIQFRCMHTNLQYLSHHYSFIIIQLYFGWSQFKIRRCSKFEFKWNIFHSKICRLLLARIWRALLRVLTMRILFGISHRQQCKDHLFFLRSSRSLVRFVEFLIWAREISNSIGPTVFTI